MTPPSNPHPLRIFIVENHPDTLTWLQLYLEDCGHTVLSACTLGEALETFPTADCDVLVSDIGLPDGNGWELMEQLRPAPRFAIAMSGFGMGADTKRSRAAGYRYHLLKPYKPSELDRILAEAAAELTSQRTASSPE